MPSPDRFSLSFCPRISDRFRGRKTGFRQSCRCERHGDYPGGIFERFEPHEAAVRAAGPDKINIRECACPKHWSIHGWTQMAKRNNFDLRDLTAGMLVFH